MKKVKELAEKWYKKLDFPSESDERFYSLLENMEGLYECDIKTYLEKDAEDKEKNAIMFLYFCEDLERQYKERGIDEDIFYASIKYLPDTLVKSDFKVDKEAWIALSLKFEIFRLGRLQFQISKMYPEGKDGGFTGKGLCTSAYMAELEQILHTAIRDTAAAMYGGCAGRTPSDDACKFCRMRNSCGVSIQ